MTHPHHPDGVDIVHYPDDPTPAGWHQPVLALGNFDGVHRGHAKIVDLVCRRAEERGATAAALTFDPHPSRVVRPGKAPPLLMTTGQKLDALRDAGIEGIAVVRFTRELSTWAPEAFVRTVLVEWLQVAEVWVGANFLFGHDRTGNFSLLRSLGARYGFRAEKIDPVRYRDFVVSSTRVRRLITEGRVDEAGALLGHHYMLAGTVARGAGRGRQIGFPTANLETANELLPPHGVYATAVIIDGEIHAAVTNVGVRPTFETSPVPVVESHLLDQDRDLYGITLRVAFIRRLRDEVAFADGDALRAQITRDCDGARALFRQISL
jgi:riboflavin kinase/FMN adenylyltransferase